MSHSIVSTPLQKRVGSIQEHRPVVTGTCIPDLSSVLVPFWCVSTLNIVGALRPVSLGPLHEVWVAVKIGDMAIDLVPVDRIDPANKILKLVRPGIPHIVRFCKKLVDCVGATDGVSV